MKKMIIISMFLSLFWLTSCFNVNENANKATTSAETVENKVVNLNMEEKLDAVQKWQEQIVKSESIENLNTWESMEMMDLDNDITLDDDKSKSEDKESHVEVISSNLDETQKVKPLVETKIPWTYKEHDWGSLSSITGNIVLFFHATWCPSCNSADKNLKSSTIPDWLTILKVDYDSSTELKEKYWVVSQHTFVQVDSSWKSIEKWFWWRSIEDITSKLK